MIYTVTMNPSLDYHVSVGEFKLGATNRTVKERLVAGGKGINVSRVLKNMGLDSIALGFVAGFTGAEISRQLDALGVCTRFVNVSNGSSRINVKVDDVDATEINGMGPVISAADKQQFMFNLMNVKGGDTLVLSGSAARGLGDDIYVEVLDAVSYKGVKVCVDASGDLLKNTLSRKPYLVKPNKSEAEAIIGGSILALDDALVYAKRFVEMGAENVILSMGAEGAVYANASGDAYKREAYKGEVVSSVGAGDSMIAGFLTEMQRSNDPHMAFEMAVLCAAATTFTGELATIKNVENIVSKI